MTSPLVCRLSAKRTLKEAEALATPAQPAKQVVVQTEPAATGEGAPGVVVPGNAVPPMPETATPKRLLPTADKLTPWAIRHYEKHAAHWQQRIGRTTEAFEQFLRHHWL